MKTITYSFSIILYFMILYPLKTDAQEEDKKSDKQDDEIFKVVEDMPQFPGGQKARINFIKDNLEYPESARKNGVEGTVYVSFVVNKDGSISNAEVLRGIDPYCDKAALEVVKSMPDWEPGRQRGEPVRVQFNMPIPFKLDDEESDAQEEDKKSDKQDDKIFKVVEQQPHFPGGDKARKNFIKNKLEYPEPAQKNGVEGTVYVSFVVNKDGSISNAEVLRGIDPYCDKAALEVVKSMPDWEPGRQRGEPVRVQFNMPIRFKLEEESDKNEKEPKELH